MWLQRYEKVDSLYLILNSFFVILCKNSTNSMIIIADSGSTKTDWAVIDGSTVLTRIKTQGINPFHQSAEVISSILSQELLPSLDRVVTSDAVSGLYFYGSGCTPEKCIQLKQILSEFFPETSSIDCAGDLLAAARAVCGRKAGIACILGTGANSCLYDGEQIIANTPPLGYILGDEGSGAVLGKLFMNGIFKGFLPESLKQEYLDWSGLTYGDVIDKVYRQPLANRFLAKTANFIASRMDTYPELEELVCNNFRSFFDRNLVQYKRQSEMNTIGFVGGISHQFSAQLTQVAMEKGYTVAAIMKSPIDGLVKYHAE